MAYVDPNFWNGKQVFLTGHTGFKGSWMALWLQHMGADVAGYALAPPTNPAVFDLAHVADDMSHQVADVRDLDALSKALKAHKPDVVIHMAAQALVRESYEHPVDTYATNVMGTVNLLEACRRTDSVRAAVVVTTDKCYENCEHMAGYTEDDAMGGYDPYSSSKGAAEIVTAAYRQSYFNPADWGNHGVGGGDRPCRQCDRRWRLGQGSFNPRFDQLIYYRKKDCDPLSRRHPSLAACTGTRGWIFNSRTTIV